jgi:hypothetical protein
MHIPKIRLAIIKRTQTELREEMRRRGIVIDLANLCRICNGNRATWTIDRERKAIELIEAILNEWEVTKKE